MLKLNRIPSVVFSGIFFLFEVIPAFAVVGEVVIANNGEPLAGATVSFGRPDGSTVAEGRTDESGLVVVDLPENAQDQPMTAKVKKSDDDDSEVLLPLILPGGESWYRFTADTEGGIVGFTRPEFKILQEANQPITVGSNSEVGSGARLKQKVTETVGGLLGGAVGGLFGGSGLGFGGGGSDDDKDSQTPELADDPISMGNKRIFTDPATGTRVAVGGQITSDGLLISTSILASPDDGTFQTVFLQDPEGNRAGPIRYYIYEMYADWTLTVSWTYDQWVDGQHVEHREGGWDESGQQILGTFTTPGENDGIWKRTGFTNAVRGIRGLGTLFPVPADLLQQKVMNLVIHITRPSQDVVTTIPFLLSMAPGGWQNGFGSFVRPL